MPLDSALLYGEMAGSWLCHLAVPLVAGTAVTAIDGLTMSQKAIALLAITVVISFLVQFGFLVFLQQSACGGVKDYMRILKGAGVAMVITAIMVAIPLYWETGRLMISQLLVDHKTLLTPTEAMVNDTLVKNSTTIINELGSETTSSVQRGGAATSPVQRGGALTGPEYDAQTFTEMMYGAAYWSGFAGAYGIGAGSMISTKCKATK
jgi:hypothetical protein